MLCKNCGVRIPFNKAPDLEDCSICGTKFTPDVRDILEYGQFGIAREVRPTQVDMARDIEDMLQQTTGTLLAEGGTGIGKSFAYLLPSILSAGKRVVVSTAKKTLQDQLANKDIPFLLKKLGLPNVKYGVYKGKSNYACWKLAQEVPGNERPRFEKFVQDAQSRGAPADIADWAGVVPRWWSKISIDNCVLSNRCPHFKDCRPHPKDYSIIVTNHHLMAIDMKVLPGTLFGPYNTLILDEAHQAPEAFRAAYSRAATFKGIDYIRSSLKNDDYLRGLVDDLGVTTAKILLTELEDVARAFKDLHRNATRAAGSSKIVDIRKIAQPLDAFLTVTDACAAKLFLVSEDISRAYSTAASVPDDSEYSPEQLFAMMSRAQKLHKRVSALVEFANDLAGRAKLLIANPKEGAEYLTICDDKGLTIQPLDIGKVVAAPMGTIQHKVILSATLAMGRDFEFTKQRFGLTEELRAPTEVIKEKIYPSPFDMSQQAILYLPRHLPLPAHAGQPEERSKWIRALSTEIAQLIGATEGDAFVLFSAKSDMNEVLHELGHDFWDDAGLSLILHEGEATATLSQYLKTPKAVLFGLKSFWEGVDVPGDKLKLVVIPKLPFPNPKDPLISALSDKAGSNSFMRVMVPHMFFDMKQGVGRLIRTQSDRGFVAILDARIWTGTGNRTTHLQRMEKINADPHRKRMGYGKQLLDVLGFTQITDDFTIMQSWVKKFFKDS